MEAKTFRQNDVGGNSLEGWSRIVEDEDENDWLGFCCAGLIRSFFSHRGGSAAFGVPNGQRVG